jgi:hypothetical protein
VEINGIGTFRGMNALLINRGRNYPLADDAGGIHSKPDR